ncbi:peptide-N4-(N-acetyl-beta-glucosaminyl)asparagine amidase A-like [Neltuma alba]|uniref:peptide-N4-(N-acetyl-beta- glucosaminyl)asparagine amidase A-like n=1 Tax=Neltuma alba TaxID=207710 RepID=UPI0010A59C60|nr:peptide-N4-(N-acetyl-beta-glucosaminyl)asparagine amidase A-like [Prosopis alba]
MDVSVFSFLFFSIFIIFQNPISASNLHKFKQLGSQLPLQPTTSSNDTPPTRYFEVTKPIKLPRTNPCSYHILHHDFASTYGQQPVVANYIPPSHCPSHKFSKIVLEWNATCSGRQFDRIFGVWLGGVEILRSCTAEPRATGIVWTVEKDITRYHSVLMKDNTLAVYMGNIVDSTYTGIYHVDIFMHFYPPEGKRTLSSHRTKSENLAPGYGGPADLIIPISRNFPIKDGLWFEIQNSTDKKTKEFTVPQNAYRAVLEVYVSFHEKDEFWYSNPSNEYIAANNLTDVPGNGPFREIVVTLDNRYVVGAIFPFTVIYTGGFNPLMWRPISGIGSFDLPTYDLEMTPLLGKILNGQTHSLGFIVDHALNVWYIDANLHLWLDGKSKKTEGKLSDYISKPLVVKPLVSSDSGGSNEPFWTGARTYVSTEGWVKSSYGNITTGFLQNSFYINSMAIENAGTTQIVTQVILSNDSVYIRFPSSGPPHLITETHRNFSLYFHSDEMREENKTISVVNITLGFAERKSLSAESGFSNSSLRNVQNGQGSIVLEDRLVAGGFGTTQQDYNYGSNEFCYFRNVSSSNYTILYDKVGDSCHNRGGHRSSFRLTKKLPIMFKRLFSPNENRGV